MREKESQRGEKEGGDKGPKVGRAATISTEDANQPYKEAVRECVPLPSPSAEEQS